MNVHEGVVPNDQIDLGISTLFTPGAVIEIRVPSYGDDDPDGTISGNFDDPAKLAAAIAFLSGKHVGIYYTLNPVNRALVKVTNTFSSNVFTTTADTQILTRRWLLIDLDPKRKAKTSSTDAEKALALQKVQAVHDFLQEQGWPEPIVADSGNGGHLLYAISLPNTPEIQSTIRAVLNFLAAKFDDAAVQVDRTVYNASRICKSYGSLACKGSNTADRPHRLSMLQNTDGGKEVVTLYQLQMLVATTPVTTSKPGVTAGATAGLVVKPQTGYASGGDKLTPEKIEEFLAFYGIEYSSIKDKPEGKFWILKQCPFNPEHGSTKEIHVSLNASTGKFGFGCKHNSCTGNDWHKFREHLENTQDKRFFFFTNAPQAVAANTPTAGSLITESFADIKAEAITWLWYRRIPIGKLTLFVGHPGIGKGCATADIAARGSTGADFPDAPNTMGPRDVLILSSEDDPADTLKPRLMACGADMSRIHNLKMTVTAEGKEKIFSLDTDLPMLRKYLESHPNIGLIVIDPIMNHLGKMRGNVEQEFRNMSTPLGELAAKFKIAIILVTHFNKNVAAEMIQRIGGCMAIVGAVRMAWGFVEDENKQRRMLPAKANLAKDLGGLNYAIEEQTVTIDGKPEGIAHIVWGPASFDAIDEYLKSDTNPQQASPKTGEIMVLLSSMLADGLPHPAAQIEFDITCKGYSSSAITRAKNKLGVHSFKEGGMGGTWFWQLPKKVVLAQVAPQTEANHDQ